MNKSNLQEKNPEYTLKSLQIIDENSSPTQRDMAKGLDLSLGKINFLIKSLINQGFVKADRFKNSNKKSAYLYYLTQKGFEQKVT